MDELDAVPAADKRRWRMAAHGAGAAHALEWAGLLQHGDRQIWMADLNSVANGHGRRDRQAPAQPTHAEHELVRAARKRLSRGQSSQPPPETVWRPQRYLLCEPEAGEPAVNLVEIRPGHVSFRIRHTSEALFPGIRRPPWDPLWTVSDDVGTEYRCGGNQSGAIVTCEASPAPPRSARELSVTTALGDVRSFDLAESRSGETADATVEYLDTGDAPLVGPAVAVERFILALRAMSHFPLVYAESGIRALGELGLLGAEELDRALDRVRAAAADRRPVMTRPQRLFYPDSPSCAGVRVGAVILFDDAVSIRWGQLPPEYRLGGPNPWLLLDYDWGTVDWMLTDDLGSVYHPISRADAYGGFFSYPYWNGEQAFVPRVPGGARQLRMTVEQRTAVLDLEPRQRERDASE